MLNNYLKSAIRNLLRHKTFSFINIFGLAVGMSVCLLVIVMLSDQYRYDQFHQNKHRIFRILSERPDSSLPYASTSPALAQTLGEEYPVVATATALVIGVGGDATSDRTTAEMRGFFADENFFDIFGYELKHGNKDKALNDPNTMVITSELSEALFGEENPVGQSVQFSDRGLHYLKSGKDSPPLSWGRFTITGVIADKKYKSHLAFDVLMSATSQKLLRAENKIRTGHDSWDGAFTYVLVNKDGSEQQLQAALDDLQKRKYARSESLKAFRLKTQPLTAITPGIMVNQPTSFQLPIGAYYFMGLIALAVILSACMNYANLSTARALTRAKEIGVRKVSGARRKDLAIQFLSESVITSFLALLLAIAMLVFIKPAFTNLWLNRYLNFDLQIDYATYLVFAALALTLGVIAGSYPALHLSSFHPIRAIKNPEGLSSGKLGLRKVLGIAQFVISLFFVITSILIFKQFRHFVNFEYGFDAGQIVNVELQGNDFNKISQAFNSVPGVAMVSGSEYIPGTGRTSGMDVLKPGTEEAINFRVLSATDNFAENLGVKLIAGENIKSNGDSASHYIILNETAVKLLGFDSPRQAVGEALMLGWDHKLLTVAGVVEDFSLRPPVASEKREPAFLRYDPENISYANLRIASGNIAETMSQLAKKWKQADPVHVFKYQFYDEELASTHAGIFDVVSIVGFLAFVAVSISCLGLLGMATYTTERRKKEVGIRKVLGAETMTVIFTLSRDYLKILAIAVCIGAPLTWFINNLWLQLFPNRAPFGVGILFAGTSVLLAFALLTIAFQTMRVARNKPAESLKME